MCLNNKEGTQLLLKSVSLLDLGKSAACLHLQYLKDSQRTVLIYLEN